MRIAIYTPLAATSAIGRVALAVAHHLADRGHRITLVRSERERDEVAPAHATALPVLWWHDVNPAGLAAQQDVIVAHVGDNHGFHAGVLPLVDAVPVVGIFHDFFLYSFFREAVFRQPPESEGFARHRAAVSALYGEDGPDLDALGRGETDLADIAAHYPMTEWLASRCGAALAHAPFYRERLLAACPGSVAVAALPYPPRTVAPKPAGDGPVVLVTVGHVNANKRCDRVIEALASTPALAGVQYRLVGPITDAERARLEALAAETAFKGLVIRGAVSDADLEAELAGADLISCLRSPILEGASASAIEAMMAGRAVIVADAGFYAGLPDDKVAKVPADIPVAALAATLERLVADPVARRRLGDEAGEWARQTFTMAAYVATLERLIDAFIAARPALGLSMRYGAQLRQLGLAPDDAAAARVGAALQDLFGYER